MAIELNHTIVHAKNKKESANFLSEILGLPKPETFGFFLIVRTQNGVSLDFIETDEKFDTQHYAFLVSDKEFDEIFERIKARGLNYWADPARKVPNQINTHFGGRGVYFADPSGHYMEIITKPYGKWEEL
jgi:catechol 2,3-dioxygenase-like lactoylglutathione lyase family enzyme